MTIWIALLRGINVGGKNRIKMEDLRRTLEEAGLQRVQTYIQSGNVLFCSDDQEESIRQRIEHLIRDTFELSIPVIVRTLDELKRTVNRCPFSKTEIKDAEAAFEGESLYVSFLQKPASEEQMERLNALTLEGDRFQFDGSDVYLLFRQSIRKSKLGTHLGKLKIPSTVRNWNTIQKLIALGSAMEGV